jgi:hypothetical protein
MSDDSEVDRSALGTNGRRTFLGSLFPGQPSRETENDELAQETWKIRYPESDGPPADFLTLLPFFADQLLVSKATL